MNNKLFRHFLTFFFIIALAFPRNFTTKERGIRSLFVASIRIRNLFCSMRYLTKISIYFPYIILIEIFDRWYGTVFYCEFRENEINRFRRACLFIKIKIFLLYFLYFVQRIFYKVFFFFLIELLVNEDVSRSIKYKFKNL